MPAFASAKIGMALNPKLRLLVIQNGSELDANTLTELETLAKENNFQFLVEIVSRTKDDERLCTVVIKDGCVQEEDEE